MACSRHLIYISYIYICLSNYLLNLSLKHYSFKMFTLVLVFNFTLLILKEVIWFFLNISTGIVYAMVRTLISIFLLWITIQILFLFFSLFWVLFILCVFPQRPEGCVIFHRTWVKYSCEQPCRCWEPSFAKAVSALNCWAIASVVPIIFMCLSPRPRSQKH